MLAPVQLRDFVRALEGTKVLTIYYDARVTDPAMRRAWRPALASALRLHRARLADDRDRAEFDRAAALLSDPLPVLDGVWGAPGWVAFLAATGVLYTEELPVRPPTYIVWRDGPAVAPYLRALKQHRPVIVALVDSRSARFYRYAWGTLTALPEKALQVHDGERAHASSPSAARRLAFRAARSAIGSEDVQRRRQSAFHRLMVPFGERLAELAGSDGWILIGGTPEWARLAAEHLPTVLEPRLMVSATLDHDERETNIVREAKRAATELRASHGLALIDRLVEQRGDAGRAAIGTPAVQRALRTRAVDVLLTSPEFVRVHAELAEDLVRDALTQGADIEVLSGSAAEYLDAGFGGVAARLRFAIGSPPAAMELKLDERTTTQSAG